MLQPQHSGNCSPPTTTTPRDSSNELGHWPTTPSSSGLNQPNNIPNIFDSNKIHNADKGYHFLNSELYNRNNNNSNSDNNLLCTVFTTQNSQYQDQLVPVSIFLPFTLRSVPLEIISFGEIVESKPSNYESSNAATNSARELFHQVEKFWRKFKGEFVHPYPIGFQAILRLRRRRRVKKSPEADWISDTAIERIQLKLEIIKGEVGPQFVVTDISSSKGVGQRFVGSSCSHPFTEAFQLYQPDEVPDTNENGEIIEYSYLDVDTDELTGLSAFGFCDLYFQSILNSIAKQAHRYLPDQINIFDGRSKEFWKTTLEREKQKLMMEIVELEKKKQVLMKLSTTKPSTRDSSNPVTTKPRRVVKKRTKRPVMDVEDTPSFADGEDSLKEAVSDSEPSQQQISPNNIGSASSIVSPIKKIKMDGTATEEVSTPNRIEAVFPTTNNNAMDLQNDLEIGPSSSSMHDDLELRLLKGSPHPPSSNHQSPIKPSNMQQSQPTIEKRNTVSQESIAEDSDKEDQHVHVTPTRMSLVNMPNSPKLEKINISPAKRNPISLELKDAVDIMEVSKEKETSIQQSSLSLTPPSHQQQHVQSNSPEFAIPALPSLQPLKKNASQTQQSQHSIETASVPQTSQPQASISQHHDDNTSKPKSQSEEVVIKPGSTITQDSPQLDEIIDEDGERDGDTMNGVSVTKDGDISRELAQKHDEMVTEDGHDIQNSKPQKSDIITVNPAAEVKETEIVQVLFDTTSATVKPQTDDKHMDDTTTLSTTTLMQNQQGKNPNITNEVDDDATPTDIILETDQFSNSIKERVETKLSPQLAEEISNASHSMQTANQETTSKIESTSHQEINMVTTTITTADQTTTTLTNVSHAFMPTLEVQFSGEMPSPSSANSNNSTGTTHFEAATGQEVASVKISTAGVASGMITNDHSDEETPKDLTPPVQVFEDTSKNFNPLVNDTPSKTKAKTEITMHNDEEIPATPTPAKPLLTDDSSPARTELATPTYEHTPAMDMSSKTIIPATIVLDPLELGGEDDMVDDDFDSNDEDDKQPISTPPNNTSRILSYTTPRSERGEDGASISSQAAVEETQYPAIKIDLDLGQLSPSKKNNPFMQAPVCENEQSESDEEQESPKTPSPTALGLNLQFSSPPLINTISPIVKTSVTSPIVFNNNNSKAPRLVFEPTMQVDFDADSDDDYVLETGKKPNKPASPPLHQNSNYSSTPEMTPPLLSAGSETGADENERHEEVPSSKMSTVQSSEKKQTTASSSAHPGSSSSSSNVSSTPPLVTLSQNSLPNHPILKINRQHPLKPYSKIKINSPVVNMVFAPIGEPKLAICTKLEVSIRELTGTEWTQTELFDLLFEEQEQFYCVRFTPDAEMLIIARSCFEPSIIMTMSLLDDGNQEEKNQEGTETFHVRFFEIDGQHQKQTGIEKKPALSLDDIRAPISTMEISGKTLVVSSTNGDVLKYSLGEDLRSRKGVIKCASLNEKEIVSKLEFVSSLPGFVIGTSASYLGIWKLADGSLLRKISLSPFSMIRTTVVQAVTSGSNQGIFLMCVYKNSSSSDKNQQNCGLFFLNEATTLVHTFERKDAPQKVLSQTETDIMTSLDVVRDTENAPYLVAGTSRGRLLLFNYRSTQCLGFIVDLDGENVGACCFHDRFSLLAAGGTKNIVIYYQDKYNNEQQ